MNEQEDVRACDCPRCDGFAERLLKAEKREDDLYHCMEPVCHHLFIASEDWARVNTNH